jgi:hypothetical protein
MLIRSQRQLDMAVAVAVAVAVVAVAVVMADIMRREAVRNTTLIIMKPKATRAIKAIRDTTATRRAKRDTTTKRHTRVISVTTGGKSRAS